MGLKLADKIRETIGEEGVRGIDVIIPVPETSNTAAAVVSERLKIPLSNAFVKNRFVRSVCIANIYLRGHQICIPYVYPTGSEAPTKECSPQTIRYRLRV